MTDEEKSKIEKYRIMIVGKGDFADAINRALLKVGFRNIIDMEAPLGSADIAVDVAMNGISAELRGKLPVVYPFDFIEGGGAIVVFPEDEKEFLNKQNIRVWAAEYLAGYCAFWNVEDCDWLHDNLPYIKEGKTSVEGQETASHICVRIAANISVSRDVKRYPRFYLSRNLK